MPAQTTWRVTGHITGPRRYTVRIVAPSRAIAEYRAERRPHCLIVESVVPETEREGDRHAAIAAWEAMIYATV